MSSLQRFLTKETITRLSFELLVVFIGVSAAFIVDNYREKQEQHRQSAQVYSVLALSLRQFHEYGQEIFERMQSDMAKWESRDTTQFVAPPVYREPGGEGPPIDAWIAMQGSGGVEIIEARLFWDLTIFFNRVQSLRDRYQRYNNFTEQELWPRMHYGPAHVLCDESQHAGLQKSPRETNR
ncbi:MAG: hypothetical protein ACT4O1_14745 [Gemmatimonadota bacterium]